MREPYEYEAPICAEVGGDAWFPEKGGSPTELQFARTICSRCIHREECQEWGIHNERFGIWGGLTEMDRRRIRRHRGIVLREDSYD